MTNQASKSKSFKSFKNFSTALIKAFCTSIFGFIITPLVIGYVGDEAYGLYKLIFDWLSNVWMFDLGVSGAFLAVSAAYVKKDEIKDVFSDGFRLHLKILPLLFVASCAFYFLILNVVELKDVSLIEYTIAFWIVASTFIFFPLNIFRQYFEISERSSLINGVTIIQLFLTNVAILILSYSGFGLIGLCIAYSTFVVFGYLVIFFYSFKEQRWKPKELLSGSGLFIEKIRSTGKSYLSINISQKISFLADNTIIAYFFSPSVVVIFFISQRLGGLFQSQLQSLGFSSWASLISFYHQKDLGKFREKFIEVFKFNFFIVCLASLLNFLFNERFVAIWIGEKYFVDESFNIIISALLLVNVINFLIGHILTGTGHVKAQSRAYLIFGVFNLAASILLTKFFGLHGPVFASLFMMGGLLIFKFTLLRSQYFLSLKSITFIVLKHVFLFGLITQGEVYLSKFYSESWLNLSMHIAIVCLAYGSIGFFWIFSKDERVIWYARLRTIYRGLLKI